MTIIEIFLIVVGTALVVISFFISEKIESGKKQDENSANVDLSVVSEEIMRQQVERAAKNIIDDTMEKVEAMLDKMSNEKIMAVSEYSDTVLKEIEKNHEEIMFLYSMLNDKETDIKNTVRDIENAKKTVKQISEDVKAETEESREGSAEQEQTQEKETTQNTVSKEEESRKKRAKKRDAAVSLTKSNNNQKIMEMYHDGVPNVEIAKKLGIGIGEVRLVIDLFKNRKS